MPDVGTDGNGAKRGDSGGYGAFCGVSGRVVGYHLRVATKKPHFRRFQGIGQGRSWVAWWPLMGDEAGGWRGVYTTVK